MTESGESYIDPEFSDPESIAFIGRRDAAPEVNLSEDAWMIEFYYGNSVTFHAVNGSTKEEAISNAIREARAIGETFIAAESVVYTRLGGPENGA